MSSSWSDEAARLREVGGVSPPPPFRKRPRSCRAAQIADASAPFWGHVRDALAERHP
jgi:hypothetical protein